MTRILILLALCSTIGFGAQAQGHTRSESHSSWVLDGRMVDMSFSVADFETRRIGPDGAAISDSQFLAYLAPLVGVTAREDACQMTTAPRMLHAASGFRRAEFRYLCPGSQAMRLSVKAFFHLVPTHVNFAQIQRPDGEFIEQLITADHTDIDLTETGANGLTDAPFGEILRMGVLHIFTGVDHMSFLIGLVLISRRLRDLVFVVTGFTIGHSMTLALAVTGIIRPHAEFIDALVALTITLIGLENIALSSGRPGFLALWVGGALLAMTGLRFAGIGLLPPLLLGGAALFSSSYLMISGYLHGLDRLRLVVTMIFGLVHGFGFAADLLGSRLPQEQLAKILVGFNLGVEIGQLTLVLAASGLVLLLARFRLSLSRSLTVDVLASVLVSIGCYWFIGRSYA